MAGESEESVFAAVGLPYIPPELRENRGEIEAALNGLLPNLIERSDLRGDLHSHTVATDGHGTLDKMARAAVEHGLEYLAITEHSEHLTSVDGVDTRALLRQMDEIDALNDKLKGFRVLTGIEVDILEDGGLDLPDAVLGRFDLVVGAVRSKFHLTRAQHTRRSLKAMDHLHFSILAHPTGRLIAERGPYEVDMARVIRHARERGCLLELNAYPERLDLTDTYCHMAREEGVLVSINSDAHSRLDFVNLIYGVGHARRGWWEAGDVLNTRPFQKLLPLLRKTM
jgi:DNA polymerase (family 10)